MSQLTSIQNLRASSALQSRVTEVEHYLKRLNPSWQAEWFFPIAIINVSNGPADCSWVRYHTDTHHKGDGTLYSGGASTEASKVIQSLKDFQARSDSDFVKLNELLTSAFGAAIDWTQGVGGGAAVEQDPFGQAPVSDSESVPSTSSAVETKPAVQRNGAPVKARKSTPKPIKTKAKPLTKLDDAKKLFSELTPKQKVDLLAWAEEKVLASKPCMAEREKLVTASA